MCLLAGQLDVHIVISNAHVFGEAFRGNRVVQVLRDDHDEYGNDQDHEHGQVKPFSGQNIFNAQKYICAQQPVRFQTKILCPRLFPL